MQDQPSTYRFSLRALFVCTAFMGLGLLAVRYPCALADQLLNLVLSLLYPSAVALAFLTRGGPRRFWATFAIFAVALGWSQNALPAVATDWFWWLFHKPDSFEGILAYQLHIDPYVDYPDSLTELNPVSFRDVLWRLLIVACSTTAAYVIPRLTRR